MRRQGALLSVLLLLGTLPLFSQTKEQAKPAAQQSTQQQITQTVPPPEKPNAQPGPIVIPPEAAKKENPVKPTASSIAAGKQRFTYDCAMCHNANGNGKGDLAESMKLKIPDFRDPEALKSVTDGGLFYVISKGHDPMPAEESRAKPNEIWNLVNYVRSFAETKVSQKSK
jgi:mono/diheme cytochrome c family protein